MRVFVKDRGNFKIEAWVEEWSSEKDDFVVVSEAECLIAGNKCLIDTIRTPAKYRNKGYATAIIKELQKYFNEVAPISVLPNAVDFWKKFKMEDALGEERDV